MKRKAPRLRKKNVKREARQRRWRRTGKFGLLLALLGALGWGGHWALSHLEFFSLQKIEVLGAGPTLGEAEILRRSQVRLGTPLFSIPIQQVQARLKEHPFYKDVSVRRRLPHTLVIEVREHFPEFVLNTGRFYYVDRDGEIFKDVTDTEDSRDLVVLSGFSNEMLVAEPQKAAEAMRSAAELKKLYKDSPFWEALGLSEIHFEKNIGFTLYPEKKKYSIKVGLKDFPEKIKKFQEIWDKLQKSNARLSSIDLNYPGKVLMTL
ncbi:MAG TPA: hypothetical protein DF383_12020 [Deltaproteobacteria bacterium]|nr:hypothetical protein [Deltaproteobacteria bacterium]